MSLLDFARGPALQWAIMIMVFGLLWRFVGLVLIKQKPDFSAPRRTDTTSGAMAMIFGRFVPRQEFLPRTAFHIVLSYVFHVGFILVLFGFAPHIVFIHDITGLSWPGLPNGLIYLLGALTVGSLVALGIRRAVHPVLRLLSNFDDWFSWFVTLAPVATGLAAFSHLMLRYETMLGLHIASVELLMVWLPFGKLMHMFLAFLSRGTTGALLTRKGAAL